MGAIHRIHPLHVRADRRELGAVHSAQADSRDEASGAEVQRYESEHASGLVGGRGPLVDETGAVLASPDEQHADGLSRRGGSHG